MIASLFVLAALPVQIVCTNCNGVGYFEVPCSKCSGSGVVSKRVKRTMVRSSFAKDMSIYVNVDTPCPDCLRGLSSKGKRGTGKKKKTCKVCHGYKKIKVKK